MRSWITEILRTGSRWFFATPLVVATLLFLATACSSPLWPTPTVRRLEESCSDEHRRAAMQVSAPRITVPDFPSCTVQLQILPDKTQYGHGDPVTIIARFSVQGDCELHSITTYIFYQLHPIRFLDQSGEMVPVTKEWQEMMDKVRGAVTHVRHSTLTADDQICYQLPIDQWYDLSAPGPYTLTLEYLGIVEMSGTGGVISNPITFTRRP